MKEQVPISHFTVKIFLFGHWSANSEYLRNRTGEGRRRQTLCDKRYNNFVRNNFLPNFTFFKQIFFAKKQKTLMLSEDHDKTRK